MIEYKDKKTNLPLPSYDLWEEKHVVSVFTSSLVYKAMMSAYNFAKTLGKDEDASVFFAEADNIRRSMISRLWDDNKKYFFKLSPETLEMDTVVDASSFYGVFRFGILPIDDIRLKDMHQKMISTLSKGNIVGGYARYENDQYYKSSPDSAGNPWPLISLWSSQYKIASSSNKQDLLLAASDLEWVASVSKGSMLSEQLHPKNGSQISATPLAWAHAEFVRTVIEFSEKRKLFSN
jgi:GH15 family glucan-1,4-alpha-glucosidase